MTKTKTKTNTKTMTRSFIKKSFCIHKLSYIVVQYMNIAKKLDMALHLTKTQTKTKINAMKKTKTKTMVMKRPNMCHIFEKEISQGYQIS